MSDAVEQPKAAEPKEPKKPKEPKEAKEAQPKEPKEAKPKEPKEAKPKAAKGPQLEVGVNSTTSCGLFNVCWLALRPTQLPPMFPSEDEPIKLSSHGCCLLL